MCEICGICRFGCLWDGCVKWHKLQAIQPQHVLALQQEGELEPVLRLAEAQTNLEIHHLPVSAKATRRSHATRRAHREERFRLEDFAPKRDTLRVLARVQDTSGVRNIAFGSLRLEPSGREVGEAAWR